MNANPGKGPGSNGVDGPNRIIAVVAIPVTGITWPFSARHNSPNGDCRRLISRYPYASLSYGKSERDLDLPEAAGRRAEGRVRGMRRRRSLNDWRGGGGGRDHAGQGAAE
jgi:hypothetical protein